MTCSRDIDTVTHLGARAPHGLSRPDAPDHRDIDKNVLGGCGVAAHKRYIKLPAGALDALEKAFEPHPIQGPRRRKRNEEMHSNSSHGGDVADIGRNRFVPNGAGRMKIANEVCILGQKIRAEDERVTARKIDDGGVVTDADGKGARLHPKLLADFADERAFAKIAEFHDRLNVLAQAARRLSRLSFRAART